MNEKLIFEFLNQRVVMNLVLLPNNIHAACVVVGVKLLNEKVHGGRSTILCRMPVRVCYWAAKEPFQPRLAVTLLVGRSSVALGRREAGSKQGSQRP